MRRNKTALVVVAALSVSIIAAAIRLTDAQNDRIPNALSSKKIDDATPIQEGVLTEKQKAHSKLFKKYDDVTRGRKLRDLVAEDGDVEVVKNLGSVLVPDSVNLQEYLNNLSCKADAVVIGRAESKSSQIIDEGTFVFTDYQLTVEQVLRGTVTQTTPTQTITVTRVGGAVTLNGHHVRATDHRQETLTLGGRYLLYLRFVPETGAFRAFADTASEDTFQLIGSKVVQTSAKAMPLGKGQAAEIDLFMMAARTAAETPCAN